MSTWEDTRDNHLQWQLNLGQLRYLPLRCWCTIVSMKPWLWVLLIGAPSGLALAAYPFVGKPALFAFLFLAFIYFLMVWFRAGGESATHYLLNHDQERIAIALPNIDYEQNALAAAIVGDNPGIELGEVERLRPYPIPGHVVVDVVYHNTNYTDPDSFVIPYEDYERVRSELAQYGLSLPAVTVLYDTSHRRTRWIRHFMVGWTAIVVIGIPLVLPALTPIDPSLYGGAFLVISGIAANFFVKRFGYVPDGWGLNARIKRGAIRMAASAIGITLAIVVVRLFKQVI